MLALTSTEAHQSHSNTSAAPHKYSCLLSELWFLSQSQPDWGLSTAKVLRENKTKSQPQTLPLSSELSNAVSESKQANELSQWPFPFQPPPLLFGVFSLALTLFFGWPSIHWCLEKAPSNFSKYFKINKLNKAFCFNWPQITTSISYPGSFVMFIVNGSIDILWLFCLKPFLTAFTFYFSIYLCGNIPPY